MKNKGILTILVLLLTLISGIAAFTGISSDEGPGEYDYTSIRGEDVTIYGKGIYRHMSADLAIQGIAQDYVTLFVGIPLLLFGLYFARKNSVRGLFVLSGTLMYFLVTYLFYTQFRDKKSQKPEIAKYRYLNPGEQPWKRLTRRFTS